MNNRHKSLHKQALGLFKANRMQEALALYKQLCSRDAGDIQAWHMAGAIAGITGDYSSAKIYCKKVIALNPHNMRKRCGAFSAPYSSSQATPKR